MSYDLYTLPGCHVCTEVKESLKEKGFTDSDYNEISLKGPGRKSFHEIYRENRENIQRDYNGIILPVLIESNESEIVKILQGDEVKGLLKRT